jgi:tellurite resistance protein TehA-like permease
MVPKRRAAVFLPFILPCIIIPDEMEEDIKDFLKRIVWSVSLGFLWLTLTLGIGTYNQLLVPEHTITIGNIIFYIWMAGTLAALIYINYRIWKKKFPHG